MGIYVLGALIFWQERSLFLDNPFQIFLMIVDNRIEVMAHRWPAVLVRILPYLAIQIGAPLKVVLMVFSLSYALFHALVFILIRFVLKDKLCSLLLVGMLTIPVSHSYFWNNSELIQGLSMLILLLALIRKGNAVGVVAVSVILPWYHPLILLPFLFVFIFRVVQNSFRLHRPERIAGLGFVFSYLTKMVVFPNWYDNSKQNELLRNLYHFRGEDLEYLQSYFQLTLDHFLFSILGIGGLLLFLLVAKRKVAAIGLLLSFSFGYLFILTLVHRGELYAFYEEVNMMIMAFFVLWTLVYIFFQSRWLPILVITGSVIGCCHIVKTAGFYTDRIQWMGQKLESMDHPKTIFTVNPEAEKYLVQEWASAFESLLISSSILNQPVNKSFLFTDDDEVYRDRLDSVLFLTSFKLYPLDQVNRRYFKVPGEKYVIYLEEHK